MEKTLLTLMPDLSPDDVVSRINSLPRTLADGIATRDQALTIKAALEKPGAVVTVE